MPITAIGSVGEIKAPNSRQYIGGYPDEMLKEDKTNYIPLSV
jgi:hypothetical protein